MAETIMALDIGLKRIGVALSLGEGIVMPQNAIIRKNRDQAAFEVCQLLQEWKVSKVVVGLPKGGADEDAMERRIKHFMGLVDCKVPLFFIDEYGSSMEAKERMKGVAKQRKDGKIDSLAAVVIMERYLSQSKENKEI
jgi:putative Holliday junction resolvase